MSKNKDDLLMAAPKILLIILFAILALTVLTQANPGTRTPSRDYGFYIYIGEQITHGKLPYRDAWESKPPAIFYTNAIALWIGRGSRWGVWVVELVSLLASIGISYSIARRVWGMWPALAGAIVWLYGLDLTLQGGNFTEEYPLPLHFLSIALLFKLIDDPRRYLYSFLLGLAFGISFLFRPNNAVIEASVILTLAATLFLRRAIRTAFNHVIRVAIGALIPIAGTGLYFWSQGLWRDLLEASILYNLSYSSTQITSNSPLQTGFGIFGALAWLGLAGYIIAAARAVAFRRDPLFPVYLFLLLGWPMAIFLSDPARRNYPHYFINWLPFIGLLSGLATDFLIARLPLLIRDPHRWKNLALGGTVLLAIAFFVSSGRASEYRTAIERINRRAEIGIEIRTRTAVYVENHTQPGELVLFWAASPGENFMSNRESPSPYLFYPLYIDTDISRRLNDQFLQDVLTNRPVLIVDIGDHEALSINEDERARQISAGFAWKYPPDNLEAFFEFVEQNYYLEAMIGQKAVYRLHGTQQK